MFEQNEWARNDRAMPDPFEIYDKLLDLQEDLKKCQRDLEEHKRNSQSPLPPPPKNPFPEAVRVIPEREEVQYQYSDKTLEVKSLKQVDNNEEK